MREWGQREPQAGVSAGPPLRADVAVGVGQPLMATRTLSALALP